MAHANGDVMLRSLLFLTLAVVGLPAFAQAGTIYRCTVAGGATVFSQVPCGKDAATVGPGGAKAAAPADPVADAAGDKAALAQIDTRCESESHRIVDGYSARFAEANASIADLHKQLMGPGSADGKDPAVQKKIEALEAHKTDLLGAQDSELAALRDQCQADRSVELKRQADRDATHVVKR